MNGTLLRLLIPVDGTSASEGHLPALLPLLRTDGVRSTLLAVAPAEDARGPFEAALADLKASLRRDGVEVETRVVWGDPATEILRAATPAEADLVAMSTHGRAGLRRELVGGVTEAVLQRAEVPVLAFRPDARPGDWTKIVAALDGSPAGEAALGDAAALAALLGATLHLVHVESDGDPTPDLEAAARRLAHQGIRAVPEFRLGDPAEEIVEVARPLKAGLVCLGTHGRAGSEGFLGHVAATLLRAAPAPILLHRLPVMAKNQSG